MSENNINEQPPISHKTTKITADTKIIKDWQIRVIVYGLTLIFCVGVLLYRPALYKYNVAKAENCFNSQNYICAFKYYQQVFNTRNDNTPFLENYFQTLMKMKKITLVQYELNNLMEDYSESTVAQQVEDFFKEYKKSLEPVYKETYIDTVMHSTNVVHWNNYETEIKVYIDKSMSSSLPELYFKEIDNVINEYINALGNSIKLKTTQNRNDAHIEILYMDEVSGGKCEDQDNCGKILGLTELDVSGSVLKKAIVKLRTRDVDDTQFTANQIYNIALHEFGHALGISGHSYSPEDVMYPVTNDAKWAENTATLLISRKVFTTRDINTLQLLYKIVPDITNENYNLNVHSDMYMPIAILGTKKEIGEKKLEESARYMDAVSTNFVSQMNLAEGYFVSRNFDAAIDAFSEALNLAETDDEKFMAYHNLAVIYYELNQYQNALAYAELANSYDKERKSNEIKAYCLIEMRQYKRAEIILENLIESNPTNPTYSAALVGAYLKQYKFGDLFAELKRIKIVNPDAFLDPVYQPYKMFTRLV